MAAKIKEENTNQKSAVDDDNISAEEKNNKKEEKEKKKAEKEKKKKEKKDKKKKKGGFILPIVILLIIVGAAAGIIGFNPFDIREKYLRSTIDAIPYLNTLLPAPEGGSSGEAEEPKVNVDELLAQIEEQKATIEKNELIIQDLSQKSDASTAEMERLREIEAQQLQIKSEKEAFDRMIAENDPTAYQSFYESIEPDTAQELYKQVVETNQNAREAKKYINDIKAIDDNSAAKILEELMVSDMNLVVTIIKSLDNEKVGAIYSAMETKNAASLLKAVSP